MRWKERKKCRKWFAWHPVKVCNEWVWLEWVTKVTEQWWFSSYEELDYMHPRGRRIPYQHLSAYHKEP